MSIDVRPASDVPWADVESVMSTPGDPRACWCQYFKVTGAVFDRMDVAAKSDSLHEQTTSGTPGLIAYVDGRPAGWVAVEPRAAFPRLLRSRAASRMARPLDATSVWSIVCFVVARDFRRRGVGGAMVEAAVEHARANGATTIEAYPVDVAAIAGSPAGYLYHGTVAMFRAAGFTEEARSDPEIRHVMRRDA
jgi:GNAT superfamily N-acetyltransferase